MKIKIHIPPECPLEVIKKVLGKAPNDVGYTPNPGWWVQLLDDEGRTLLQVPFYFCIEGLGILDAKKEAEDEKGNPHFAA